MDILHVGFSGYVGSHAVAALLQRGHRVTGLARRAPATCPNALDIVVGDIADTELVCELAGRVDAVLVTVPQDVGALGETLEALMETMEGSHRRLVLLADSTVHGDTGPGGIDGDTCLNPSPSRRKQAEVEQRLLAGSRRGVATSLVHASLVYGSRAGAIPQAIARDALAQGSAGHRGDIDAVWSAVHVWDLAVLLSVAVEIAPAGSDIHAAAFDVTASEISRSVQASLGLRDDLRRLSPAQSETAWGSYGAALGMHQRFFGQPPRRLGWAPGHVDLRADLIAEGLDARPLALAG